MLRAFVGRMLTFEQPTEENESDVAGKVTYGPIHTPHLADATKVQQMRDYSQVGVNLFWQRQMILRRPFACPLSTTNFAVDHDVDLYRDFRDL